MNKKKSYIILLAILLFVLTSCINQVSKEVKKENTKAEVVKSEDKEEDKKEVEKKDDESKKLEVNSVMPIGYKVLVNSCDAEKILNYKKISIPENINDLKVSYSGIIDKDNMLLTLYNDTTIEDEEYYELIVYNITSSKYKSIFIAEKNEAYQLVTINNDYLVLRTSNDNWQSASIYLYTLKKEQLKKIFEYSKNKETDMVAMDNANNIVLKKDKIWFDDYYMDETGQVRANLYTYNYDTGEVKLFKKDAQNPLKYKGTVIYFVKDSEGKYRALESVDNKKVLDVKEDLVEITGFSDELFCIENRYTNHEEHYTEFQIKDLITKEPILYTTRSIDALRISDKFVTWFDYEKNTPCVYSIDEKQLAVFSNLPKGINVFYLKDNFGIFLNKHNGKYDYYYFE